MISAVACGSTAEIARTNILQATLLAMTSEIVRIIAQPEMRQQLVAQGFEPVANTLEEFGA